MVESFRIIDAEVGSHPFDAVEWPVVRRIIHASGDPEEAKAEIAHWFKTDELFDYETVHEQYTQAKSRKK